MKDNKAKVISKIRLKLKWFLRKNKLITRICIFLFIFPLVIGGVYALPLPQVINVNSGDLLAYYGVAFGILASFATYRFEREKQKKERIKELKPIFSIRIDLIDHSEGLFNVNIINSPKQILSYMYFYDEYVEACLKQSYSFLVTYNKTIEQQKKLNSQFNITMDPEIIDSDGYPKYIQIMCDDRDGNTWNCCYHKVNDCGNVYYYPDNPEII